MIAPDGSFFSINSHLKSLNIYIYQATIPASNIGVIRPVEALDDEVARDVELGCILLVQWAGDDWPDNTTPLRFPTTKNN